jgi:pimeloyl-ACP methyl ester carboxylesterase
MKKIVILFIALLIALAVAIPSVAYAEKGPPFTPEPPPGVRPIVFIHGAAGSALQFHSQYLRFATNGWPVSHLFAFEWTGAFPSPETSAERTIRLDAFIDSVLDDTGADQVYLLGHSAGTAVSFAYLADSARAAKVAKYVNLDGATASAPPGGVPTLAIWAELAAPGVPNPPREIIGATNVVIVGQYHVGLVSCAETFAWIYEFFTGEPPATTDILPEPPGQVEIAGRAVFFPENTGVGDATLEIWEVDGDTGFRVYDEPTATCTLSGNWYYDGAWGPVKVNGLKHYEIVLLREGYRAHHFYFEPFMRSNYFIRLMTSAPGGIGELLDTSDNHTNLTITRDKRFLSDPTSDNDILEINGVNVLEALYPLDIRVVAMFVYDWHADGVSDLTQPIPFLHAIHNFSGIDLYMPAADPPDGTISIVLTPGDGDGKTQVVNVPNWASSGHAISIRFNDYVQEIDSWTEYVPKQAPGQ